MRIVDCDPGEIFGSLPPCEFIVVDCYLIDFQTFAVVLAVDACQFDIERRRIFGCVGREIEEHHLGFLSFGREGARLAVAVEQLDLG